MTASVLLLGFWAGLDNLQVCSSIGLAPIPRGRLHRMAAMFCFCETAAPVVGLLLGKAFLNVVGAWASLAGPAVMIVCGVAIIRAGLRDEDEWVSEAGAFALPISLCLDNLMAGVGISPVVQHAWEGAVCIGLISALMSLTGVYGAQRLRRIITRLPIPRLEMIGAAYLVFLAVRTLTRSAT